MKLQLAIDLLDIEPALELMQKVHPWVDIIEIGTPLIKSKGMLPVELFHNLYSDKLICADMKTMDAGAIEAELACQAGADLITVLGVANNSTLYKANDVAKKYNKKIMVDLIMVPDKKQRISELADWEIDYFIVHSGYDDQSSGANPIEDLALLSYQTSRPIAVAGGINLENIDRVIKHTPSIIIVGSGIAAHKQPERVAQKIYNQLNSSRAG